MSQAKVSTIETANLLPSVDDVDQLCRALSAPMDLRADLLDLTERLHTETALELAQVAQRGEGRLTPRSTRMRW
jgi:hypothetical protein